MDVPTPPDRKVSATDRAYIMLALRIAGSFGIAIAAPVVVLALAGKWLDARYSTAPRFLIAGFVLAAAFSAALVWQRAQEFGREFEDIEKRPKN